MSTILAVGANTPSPSVAPPQNTTRLSGEQTSSPLDTTQIHAENLNISPSSRLQSERDMTISLGNRTRAVDQAFQQAGELIEKMKTQLTSITKQFPPFGPENAERLHFLNSFSGLRAQLEALTFPREPQATGDWANIKFPEGELELNIPNLDPGTATDEQVRATETMLGDLHAELAVQRQSLYDSVMAATSGHYEADQALGLARQLRGN